MNEITDSTGVVRCTATGTEATTKLRADGAPKLPPGWKRFGDAIYSPEGVAQAFRLRTVRLPVASVILHDADGWSVENCKAGWQAFRKALRQSCQLARLIANWALVELAKADNDELISSPTGYKLPKFKASAVDLYGPARAQWPDLDSQSLGSLLQKVRSRYSESRWERRVRGKATLPEFKNDKIPLPIPKKDAPLEVNEQNQPFLTVRVSGQRFRLRFRNTPDRKRHTYWPQVKALKQVAAGEGDYGEVTLYARDTEVWAAVAVYLPKDLAEREQVTITVRTTKDALWQVWVGDREEPWVLNDEQIRKVISAHRARLHRLSQDSKFERRQPASERTRINDFREKICARQRNRLDDYCEKASAMLRGLARRHKASVVRYNDDEHGFAASFPWFKLRTLCEQKLTGIGVTFETFSDSAPADTGPVLE